MDLTKYSAISVHHDQHHHHHQQQQQPGLEPQMSDLTSTDTSQVSHKTISHYSVLSSATSAIVPLPSTSAATTKDFEPEDSQLSPKNNSASSLVQLLTSPKTTVLHRPTPIHPLASRLFTLATKTPALESNLEVPLDLSQSTAARQQLLIKTQQQQQLKFLPTCANPSLNSNWIAIKFGAAVGPNRMSYPREFKLMVINYYYTNGQNKYRTCKEFQITKSMLNGWLQKIDKIRQSRPGSLKSGRSGRKPQFPDIEKQLFHLYHAHLGTGKKVGNRWIRETARNLAQQQCSEQELAGMCQFSERWLSNFKKRYRINLNRDWSSGNSSSGSLGSTESIGSGSSATNSIQQSPTKSDETAENESMDSDADSVLSDSLETLIDVEDQMSPDNPLSILTSGVFPNAQEHVQEILNKPGQLPIQAFYERFPWLCRKNQTGAEPGRRGRKVQFPGVEKVLFERLQEQQSKGERISNRWLQQQARELALQICPEVLQEATKSARCLFSEHWLHNFKKRYGITLKQANRNVVSPSKTSEISSPTTASQCDSSLTDDKNCISSINGTAAKPVTDLTTMLQLQNWFLAKYYSQEQGTHSATSLPQSTYRNTMVPLSSASMWYPASLTQCLL
uniref:HTH CENPB-type domain-containing protein n=1 Tax=Onchocerca volvulus TaxID=6282 RepID=A0A8R1U2A2_ONCVO